MQPVRLIFLDTHPLAPFTVPGYQFASRAVSVSHLWPGPAELWLPGPAMDLEGLRQFVGMKAGTGLSCRFGPPPVFSYMGLRLRSKGAFRLWTRRNLRKLAMRREKVIFYFRTLKIAFHVAEFLKANNWVYVFEPHEIHYENARDPAALKEIELSVYQRAAHLFPKSQALEDSLREKLSLHGPCTVSPNGHSGANLALPEYDPGAPPRFLYIGSLHPWKGLETAFAATAGLRTPFDVVGAAGQFEEHRTLCRQRGWTHVEFHGHVPPDQLPRFYTPGSLCLLPLSNGEMARSYTSPLKLFEYLAAGRPVVVGDVPSVREIVTDGVHARLLPVGNAPNWRRVLQELLDHRQQGARLAAAGRTLARQCTWVERARPLVEVLADL